MQRARNIFLVQAIHVLAVPQSCWLIVFTPKVDIVVPHSRQINFRSPHVEETIFSQAELGAAQKNTMPTQP